MEEKAWEEKKPACSGPVKRQKEGASIPYPTDSRITAADIENRHRRYLIAVVPSRVVECRLASQPISHPYKQLPPGSQRFAGCPNNWQAQYQRRKPMNFERNKGVGC